MQCLNSLREYIENLKAIGELQEIDQEVDWDLEVGAVIRRVNDLKAPAPLFNKIKGYPSGYRILGSPASASGQKGRFYSRIALSLGLPVDSSAAHIVDTLSRLKDKPLIAPEILPSGPCKENILTGDQIDLLKFPVPYLHDGDGGRYIGTWHIVVTQTPDKKWTNWGIYRLMVHDKVSMGGLIVPTQHIGMHFAQWKEINTPMPFAVAIGTDPLTPIIASMGIPEGINEVDVIGGYRNEPVQVVRCETVDLEVPATSEIVIEGTVSVDETRAEGPFGEYTGYMSSSRMERPVFNVSAITHRNDPIMSVVCPGEPVDDHLCMSLSLASDVLALLREKNLPVVMTFIPPSAALHILVVSVDKSSYSGSDIIKDIGDAIWSSKMGTLLPKIIVIDHDIDPTNINQVVWAFATKNHPQKGVHHFTDTTVFPLFPFLYKEEKIARKCTTVIYDCTWPSDWPKEYIPRRASFDSLWPKEIQDRVLRKWSLFGYEETA